MKKNEGTSGCMRERYASKLTRSATRVAEYIPYHDMDADAVDRPWIGGLCLCSIIAPLSISFLAMLHRSLSKYRKISIST